MQFSVARNISEKESPAFRHGENVNARNKKSTIVSFRLDNEVLERLRRNHPNVAEYLRQRITYDVTRSHRRRRPK